MSPETVLDIVAFSSAKEWRRWLAKHHTRSNGVWLRLFKRASAVPTVSYEEALDEALCCGWIDGQLKTYDEESWLRKFTPRRPKSIWSKRNREHAERLTKAGNMRAAGLKEIDAAKQDGRWKAAPKYAAFLRGINIGGHRVKMTALQKAFESLGLTDVKTYIANQTW